ncbi:MAG: hypothetical protein WDZ60_01600, partial [Wenzhouxiangellaceae bacterium]
MSSPPSHRRLPGNLLHTLKLRWLSLWRRVLHWWVRATILPEDLDELKIGTGSPVFYVLDTYAFTSLLIVEQICRKQGWARPAEAFQHGDVDLPRTYGASRRYRGLFVRRPQRRRHSEMVKQLLAAIQDGRLEDVRIVPVTVLIGRAPDKEQSIAKILFSENWELGGRIRRFLTTLVNGRATFVQFGKPVSVADVVAEGQGAEKDLRRVSRLLRVHFKRVRTAAIGPDRSHRRTLVDR